MSKTFEGSEIDPAPEDSADDMVLRMLGGAIFAPGSSIILPSGEKLGSDEAQAFTAAFADNERLDSFSGRRDDKKAPENNASAPSENPWHEDNPLSSKFDQWTDDPQLNVALLIGRAMEAVNKPKAGAGPDVASGKIGAIRRFLIRITG